MSRPFYLESELFEIDRESLFGRDRLRFEMSGQEAEAGSNGNSPGYIKWVQQGLNKTLALRLAVDGTMGPQTRSAIRSFQQRKGLVVDGLVGSKTEAALIGAGAGSPTGTPGGRPSSLPVSLFPARPADPLTADPKMDQALKDAIANVERTRRLAPGTFPVRFTLVEVTDASAGSFPSAGYLETETDYIASEAKVAVMYSAYALRDMVQRFAVATGANPANLFVLLARQMDPSIAKASGRIDLSLLMNVHRLPLYRNVFAMNPTSLGLRAAVTFTPGFSRALEGMIVPSNNADAGTCVRGVGYGYLNGALAAGGFFDPASGQGLWVAGDFQSKYPYVRIVSRNDGLVAQAGTTRDMAKLVALIMTDRLIDSTSCAEMRDRLARAASGPDTPWIARTGVFTPGTISHNKLGLGPLKSGKSVRSEVSVYQSPVAIGRRYVVAWQNLVGVSPIGFTDVAQIIEATIAGFER